MEGVYETVRLSLVYCSISNHLIDTGQSDGYCFKLLLLVLLGG